MIKARGTTSDGVEFILLGLSGENVTRLVAGEPILLSLSEVGLDGFELSIIYGQTEADIIKDLESIGATTVEGPSASADS